MYSSNSPIDPILVRSMNDGDLNRVVILAEQLGYKVGFAELKSRFDQLRGSRFDLIVVSEFKNESGASLNGWAHFQIHKGLLSEPRVEVLALVVDEKHRGAGIGRRLMEVGEKWASDCGLKEIRLGSRIERDRAHKFYKRLGFAIEKTWYVLKKNISN